MNCNDITAKNEVDQIKCCIQDLETKQLQLNGAAIEKKELQIELLKSSSFIEEMTKKHDIIKSQFTENQKAIWSVYQKTKIELENINRFKESLNASIVQRKKDIENLGCWVKQQDVKNKNLDEKNSKLKECLNEDKDCQTRLENDYQNQKVCLEKTNEELNTSLCQLEEKTYQLQVEKEENRKLKSEIVYFEDEISRTIDKSKLTELQLIKDKDILKTNVQIKKTCNLELNNIIGELKNERQELAEALKKSNESIRVLKQTIERERDQAEKCIDELRMEKSNVEREKEWLENKAEEQMEKLKTCTNQNKQFKARTDELKYKLETAVKSCDEKLKITTEKMDQINCENQSLEIELASKTGIIEELQEKLSEVERARKAVGDEIHCLKRELENLKQKQILMSLKYNPQNSCIDFNRHSSCSVNNVFDDTELDGDKIRMRLKCDDDGDVSNASFNNENDQNFEKLMSKFDSVLKYCNK